MASPVSRVLSGRMTSKSRDSSPCALVEQLQNGLVSSAGHACPTPPATAVAGSSTRPTSSSCISHLSAPFTTQRSIRSYQTKDQFIYAAAEDLADWFAQLYADLRAPEHIDADNFLNFLATGEILCRHANYIELWVKNVDHVPDLSSSSVLTHLRSPIAYKLNAQPGSFHARDNVCKFILWCREKRIDERGVIFETEDLVSRKNTNNVIYCLLDVARFVGRNCHDRVPLPGLIMLERDIEIEEQQHNEYSGDDTSACSDDINTSRFTPPSSNDGGCLVRPDSVTSPGNFSHGLSPLSGALGGAYSLNSPVDSSSAASGGVEDEVSSSSNRSSRAAESANAVYAGDEKHESRNCSDAAVRLNLSGSFTSPASNSSKRSNLARRRRTAAAEADADEANRFNEAVINNQRRTTLMQRNIDALVQDTVRTCSCSEPLRAEKISAGKFLIGRGAMTMTIYVRVLRYHIMVRVGGGWTTLSEFLEKHDPCRLHHNSLPASDVHAFLRSDSSFASPPSSSSSAVNDRSPRAHMHRPLSQRGNAVVCQAAATAAGNSPPITLIVGNNNSGLDSGLSGCESPSSSIVLLGSRPAAESQQSSAGNEQTNVRAENGVLDDDAASSSVDSVKRHSRASSTTSTSFASESSSSCCFDSTTVPSSNTTIALTATPSSMTIVAKNTHNSSKNCKISPHSHNTKQQPQRTAPAQVARRSLSSSRSVIVANAATSTQQQRLAQQSRGGVLRTPISNLHRPRTACGAGGGRGGLLTSLTAENIVRRPVSTAAIRHRQSNNIRLSLPVQSPMTAFGASTRRSRCTDAGGGGGETAQVIQPRSFSSTRGLLDTFQVVPACDNNTSQPLPVGFLPACAAKPVTPAHEAEQQQRFLSLLRAPTPVKFSPINSVLTAAAQGDNFVIRK